MTCNELIRQLAMYPPDMDCVVISAPKSKTNTLFAVSMMKDIEGVESTRMWDYDDEEDRMFDAGKIVAIYVPETGTKP